MKTNYTFQIYTANGHRPYQQSGKNALDALAKLAKILARVYEIGEVTKIEITEKE